MLEDFASAGPCPSRRDGSGQRMHFLGGERQALTSPSKRESFTGENFDVLRRACMGLAAVIE